MIVVMRPDATEQQIDTLTLHLRNKGLEVHRSFGTTRVVLGLVGDLLEVEVSEITTFEGVQRVLRISEPYRLVSREFKEERSTYLVNGVPVGGGDSWTLCAGPCAVETPEQMEAAADFVYKTGAPFLRAGAFKPRTNPYTFQGGGEEALKMLADVAKRNRLMVVTEVMDPRDLDLVQDHAHILQVGSRNMSNFTLLKELGRATRPVLLKRGMSSTIEEWLLAAEYIMQGGNFQVILCERGIRSFDQATRNLLDLSAVPLLKERTHLPVWVDPSHGTGRRELVADMALAALAAGADGLMVEMHPRPNEARSDGAQSLYADQFLQLADRLRALGDFLGRPMARIPSAEDSE